MPRTPFTVRRSAAVMVLALASISFASCSGGEPLGPQASIEFLVGDWKAERFVIQSKTNPEIAPELIKGLGGEFSINIQPSGQYTAILVYQGSPFTEIGRIEIEGNEVVFRVSYPEAAVNRSRYTLAAGLLILIGDTDFDFNRDGRTEPATARIELRRR